METFTDIESIHASIVRLRRQAEWYRVRLQETCDRIAVLEQAAAVPSSDERSEQPADDDSHRH